MQKTKHNTDISSLSICSRGFFGDGNTAPLECFLGLLREEQIGRGPSMMGLCYSHVELLSGFRRSSEKWTTTMQGPLMPMR